jgi:hypothetical protein
VPQLVIFCLLPKKAIKIVKPLFYVGVKLVIYPYRRSQTEGLHHLLTPQKFTDVSEERTASFFRIEYTVRGKEAELLIAVYRIFDSEDRSSIFFRNVFELVPDSTESYPRT